MLKEFKAFAVKGNIMDLAVGVVIGGAFGKIVTSLVNDIIMPLISLLTGGMDFKYLNIILREPKGDLPALALNYGQFIQNTLDFLIIAFSIFLFIKAINKFKKQQAPAPVKETPVSREEQLLTEIRDLLKDK